MSNLRRTVTITPGEQTIAFSREFDAPVARVFAAHVDAELVAQWTGPRGTDVRLRHFDPRTGGSWSYIVTGLGGEWGFYGSFHEVTAPRRIVQTFEYEGLPEHPSSKRSRSSTSAMGAAALTAYRSISLPTTVTRYWMWTAAGMRTMSGWTSCSRGCLPPFDA